MSDFDLLQTTLLALLQGLTEFLPISSSAHLLFPSLLLGWTDQGLAFDVAVHLGTLLAVLVYFRTDLACILSGLQSYVLHRESNDNARLGGYLILGTIPVVIAGFVFKDLVDSHLRRLEVIAATTIFFGLLLWIADRHSLSHKGNEKLTIMKVLLIGCAQVLALVPGTSRSGITMTAALFCGLKREQAARVSFLLSIPAIAGASLLLLLDLMQLPEVNWGQLATGLCIAAVSAYLCIHYFLKLINSLGFLPFVIYRLVLGCLLLGFIIV